MARYDCGERRLTIQPTIVQLLYAQGSDPRLDHHLQQGSNLPSLPGNFPRQTDREKGDLRRYDLDWLDLLALDYS